jgi:hypothetical protein
MKKTVLACLALMLAATAAEASSSSQTRQQRTTTYSATTAAKSTHGATRSVSTTRVTPINPTYNNAAARSGSGRPNAVAPAQPSTRYNFTEVAPRSLW